MVANDNCSACEFQNGLASSRRYDENRLERNRKPLGRRVQHSNGWRGGSEPNLFKHVGLEAREIPAVGEVFSLDFPLYRTWGWKQEKFQRWGKCFLLTSPSIEHPPRRKRRGFLRQPLYFSGGPRRGFTFGLPAHRSFGQKKYGAVRKEKKEGPYILGLKTPRLYGHPVNDWASNPWEPAVTLPCRSAPATPSRARQQVAFPARTSPERKIVS